MNVIQSKIKRGVRAIQKGLIVALLFVLYILGFGATFILFSLFNFFHPGSKSQDMDSFWVEAAGYDESPDELTRQS